MPTVPLPTDLYISVGTSMEQDTGTVIDRTDDGASAARDLYAACYYNLNARFKVASAEQQATLRAFFWNNRTAEILITINRVVYACYLTGPARTSFDYGAGFGSVNIQARAREVV